MVHELVRLLVNIVGINQDIANFRVEIVAQRTHDQIAFLINQKSALACFARAINGIPQFDEVVQIPLQLFGGATNTSGTRDDAHAFGVVELVHRLFELGAVVTLNTAAYATAARVVGHQYHITACKADKCSQCRTFVAALFFFHLHQQLLAFADDFIDTRLANRHAFGKILAGNFLEWQKAVAVFAVIDKASLQRWLYPRYHCLVDIAFALLAPVYFNFIIEQLLPVNNCQATLFALCSVNQHPFHDAHPSCAHNNGRNNLFNMQPRTAKLQLNA